VLAATVDLRRGKNQFDVSAVDPKTGKAADQPIRLLITVRSAGRRPDARGGFAGDGATFQNGAIPVAGHATDATTVSVAAAYLGPPPGHRPRPPPRRHGVCEPCRDGRRPPRPRRWS